MGCTTGVRFSAGAGKSFILFATSFEVHPASVLEVKQAVCEADHSLPGSAAEVNKNA
jgi:hypothetical protein